MDNSDNVQIDLLGLLIDKAMNGDTIAARKVLKGFCADVNTRVDSSGNPYTFIKNAQVVNGHGFPCTFMKPSELGIQVDSRIAVYLAECFEKILDDAPGARIDANIALKLVEPGKRGAKKTEQGRNQMIDMGLRVWLAHKEIKEHRRQPEYKPLRNNAPLDEAKQRIADEDKKSVGTVTTAYKEFKKLFIVRGV